MKYLIVVAGLVVLVGCGGVQAKKPVTPEFDMMHREVCRMVTDDLQAWIDRYKERLGRCESAR